jgi:hypothetical protein
MSRPSKARASRRLATVLALVAAAGILGAHGGNQAVQNANGDVTSNESIPNRKPGDRWNEQDIVRALHLRDADPEHPGLSFLTPSGVHVSALLTNAAAIDLYAGAGDQVATNPARNAAVRFDTDDFDGTNEEAAAELAHGLAALK